MRTARRALTVSPSMLCAGGVPGPGDGGLVPRGVPGPDGGAWSRGGGIPSCTEADPPCEQNDKQV